MSSEVCEVWDSRLNGRRSIWVVMRRVTKPAVRMTQRSMHANPAAREYLDWKQATADFVILAMRNAEIEPFPKRTKLQMDATFILAPVEIEVRPSKRAPHVRTIHPADIDDVDNLYKGIADAMKGVLYGDDRRIFGGRFEKREGVTDSTKLWVREI